MIKRLQDGKKDMEVNKSGWIFAYWSALGREREGLGIMEVCLIWRKSKKMEN